VTGAIDPDVYGVKKILSSKYLDPDTENVRFNNKRLALNECLPERIGSGDCLQSSRIDNIGAINVFLGDAWRGKRRYAHDD
jgi:hypothetical protein